MESDHRSSRVYRRSPNYTPQQPPTTTCTIEHQYSRVSLHPNIIPQYPG